MQATDEGCSPLKVVPVRLLNVLLPRLTLSFVWSGGVLQLLQAAAGLFLSITLFVEQASTLRRKQYLRAGKNGTIVAVYTVFQVFSWH